MDNFRWSKGYGEELAEATAFAYNLGFQDCKAKVGRVFGLGGVDDLEPDELEEQPAASPPADKGLAPVET